MKRADALRIVEAGYEWPSNDRDWLAGVAEAAAPFGIGSGTAAYSVDLVGKPRVEDFVGFATRPEVADEIDAFTHGMSREVAREVYSPTEFVGNAGYRVRRVASARNQTAEGVTGGNSVAAWALVGGDPRRRAVTLLFPANTKRLDPEKPFPRGRVLGLAAAHLGAALRLRRLAAPVANTDGVTESVLSPSGKVLHATGAAREKPHRESLVEAVVNRERARGRLRRVDPDEAAALWSVLVAGQWSIVDLVDRDGKRLLLARKNPVAGPDVTTLTDHERDVAWLAVHGHSRKYIAYELGLSTAQVARRLASAQRKLRATSRRDLVRKFSGTT